MFTVILFIVCLIAAVLCFLVGFAYAMDPEGRGGTYLACYWLAGLLFGCTAVGIVVRAAWRWWMGGI